MKTLLRLQVHALGFGVVSLLVYGICCRLDGVDLSMKVWRLVLCRKDFVLGARVLDFCACFWARSSLQQIGAMKTWLRRQVHALVFGVVRVLDFCACFWASLQQIGAMKIWLRRQVHALVFGVVSLLVYGISCRLDGVDMSMKVWRLASCRAVFASSTRLLCLLSGQEQPGPTCGNDDVAQDSSACNGVWCCFSSCLWLFCRLNGVDLSMKVWRLVLCRKVFVLGAWVLDF
jgi:hypothetical protein